MKKVKTAVGWPAIKKETGWAASNQGEAEGISYDSLEMVSHWAHFKKLLVASDGKTLTVIDDDAVFESYREFEKSVTVKQVKKLVDKLSVLPKNWTKEQVEKIMRKAGFVFHTL